MPTTRNERPPGDLRVLVAGSGSERIESVRATGHRAVDVVRCETVDDARHRLRTEPFDAVVVAAPTRSGGSDGLLASVGRLLAGSGDTATLRQLGGVDGPSPITARLMGQRSIREGRPGRFRQLTERYGELLDEALVADARGRLTDVSVGLRQLAEQLGTLGAAPRDVIDVHLVALRGRVRESGPARAAAYQDLGRLVVLQLMGFLAAYYRRHATPEAPPEEGADGGE